MQETYTKTRDLLTRSIAGEMLVIPVRARLADLQRIYALSPVAEFVWERIDGRNTVGQISADVADQYAVDVEQAASDVREFVSELARAGLVEGK